MSGHSALHFAEPENPVNALCNRLLDQLTVACAQLSQHGYADLARQRVERALEVGLVDAAQTTLALPQPPQPQPVEPLEPELTVESLPPIPALTELDLAMILTALMKADHLTLGKADRAGNRNARDKIAMHMKAAKALRK